MNIKQVNNANKSITNTEFCFEVRARSSTCLHQEGFFLKVHLEGGE